MDFNRPITYQVAGGTTIDFNSIGASEVTTTSPRGGYKVLSANFNAVPIIGYIDKRALRDGVDAADTYLGTRSLNIVCGVFGTSTGDLGDKVQAELLTLEVSDLRGRRVYHANKEHVNGFREEIDLTQEAEGVYMLRVSDGERNAYIRVLRK